MTFFRRIFLCALISAPLLSATDQLTGFPFPPVAANVYRIDGTGAQTIAASGFTNIIDVDFGPDGDMFVLQLTTNGIAAALTLNRHTIAKWKRRPAFQAELHRLLELL